MPRSKPKNTPVLTTFGEVDDVLEELGRIEREIQRIDTDASESIARIKRDSDAAAAPHLERQRLLQAALEQFSVHHKELFRDLRSRKLRFGVVGFKKTPGKFKPMKGWKWTEVVEKLSALRKSKYIRVKKMADKEALEKDYRRRVLSDADLSTFGLTWWTVDEFYYETFSEETLIQVE